MYQKKKSGFQEVNEVGVLVVRQSQQWQAGSELCSVCTSQAGCSVPFFLASARAEVLQSCLYTSTRKSSVRVEADGCVWIIP